MGGSSREDGKRESRVVSVRKERVRKIKALMGELLLFSGGGEEPGEEGGEEGRTERDGEGAGEGAGEGDDFTGGGFSA